MKKRPQSPKRATKAPSKTANAPSAVVVRRSGVYHNNEEQCSEITTELGRCKKSVMKGTNFCCLHQRKKLQHEDGIFESTFAHVDKGVWIGSCDTANDPVALKAAGIKSVVNISGWEPKTKTREMYKSLGITYHTLTTRDRTSGKLRYLGDEPIGPRLSLEEFYIYMDKGVEMVKNSPHPVLVHCFAGINRSASLVAAYLISVHKMPFSRARHQLIEANKKRSIQVLTNKDFVKAMEHYSEHVRQSHMIELQNQLFIHKLIVKNRKGALIPAKMNSNAVEKFIISLDEDPKNLNRVWDEFERVSEVYRLHKRMLDYEAVEENSDGVESDCADEDNEEDNELDLDDPFIDDAPIEDGPPKVKDKRQRLESAFERKKKELERLEKKLKSLE